ncbi:MAG: VWA domain-containing protein [Pseudomonadales bacterium]|nr:VWA domain-containing protein [Pseudomonadales bacterium]
MNAASVDMIFANFHFLRPFWLLALIPALFLVMTLWRMNERTSAWDRAIDHDLLPFLLDTTKSVAERTPLVLLLSAWTLAILALAGPVWEKIPQPVQARQDAMVIVYDQSLSMYATDYEPNRQVVSKRKVLDILDRRLEGQTGLVVYAGDAHAVTPLTEDSITIKSLVPSINPNMMPAFGSNAVAAIETAKSMFADAATTSGTIALVTDGVDRSEFSAIAGLLANSGFRLVILGVGTAQGAPIPAAGGDFLRDGNGQVVTPGLDSAALQELANLVNGRYAGMQLSSADLDYLLSEDEFLDEDDLSEVDENFDIWYEVGPWLMLIVLPLGAMMFRRGWILSLSLLLGSASLLTPTAPAEAAGWTDLWKTRDQQAAEAMDAEDTMSAAMLFQDPNWKGAAAYKAGDYAAAIQAFSAALSTEDADAHYNLGNALAMSQMFEQAIASYNIAIALQPDHEDAIHNREIVQSLLDEQQQENPQDSEQDDGMSSEQQEQSEEQNEESQSEEEQQQQEEEQQEEQEEGEPEMQEESQAEDGQEQSESEEENQAENPSQSNAESESQESLEQWLRRIDDDPGELLQRKFQFEYRRRQMESRNNPQPTESQIW